MNKLSNWFNHQWYQRKHQPLWLKLLSFAYQCGQKLDKRLKLRDNKTTTPLPVIVVGNLTVGGTGKTPLIIAISQYLSQQGYKVGILTRAYKNKCRHYPYLVQAQDSASLIGDEAALIYQKTKAPVVIAPKRRQGLDFLAQHKLCDVVLCDDGLQHYALPRDLEIVVVDGTRGFGNAQLLPLGPLRESLERLHQVDLIVINGPCSSGLAKKLESYGKPIFSMQMQAQPIYAFNKQNVSMDMPLAAFAGIGNPQRFFDTLKTLDLKFTPYAFADHHLFQTKDFEIPESCIIMTEKDAIKCQNLSKKPLFVLPVVADLSHEFWQKLLNQPMFQAVSTPDEDIL
jgi:tetraacyldisaccharide 4'-kinase